MKKKKELIRVPSTISPLKSDSLCNIAKELALRIAKRQTEYMKAQNDFNRDYFQSLISYVTIGSDGTVGVRTKTDTTVKEDKQDG